MIIVGSVRPGRIGLSIGEWVKQTTEGDWEVDLVDLVELGLPFMDEPNHPSKRQYTKQHTFDWSARVDAADAIILVTPEYNHSFSPALKNALDFLSREWWRKPVGVVSYGGVSGGTRGVVLLEPTITGLGMVRAGAAVEIPFAATQVADGVFAPSAKESAILVTELVDLDQLATVLRPRQNTALAG